MFALVAVLQALTGCSQRTLVRPQVKPFDVLMLLAPLLDRGS